MILGSWGTFWPNPHILTFVFIWPTLNWKYKSQKIKLCYYSPRPLHQVEHCRQMAIYLSHLKNNSDQSRRLEAPLWLASLSTEAMIYRTSVQRLGYSSIVKQHNWAKNGNAEFFLFCQNSNSEITLLLHIHNSKWPNTRNEN